MGDAFILNNGGVSDLYILTGTPGTPSSYTWTETSFGGGTKITVGGAVQTTWNADGKLDAVTTSTTNPRLYMKNANGTQNMIDVVQSATEYTVPMRLPGGNIQLPTSQNTTNNGRYYACHRDYVDTKLAAKQDTLTAGTGITISGSTISATGGGGSSWNVADSGAGNYTVNITFSANKRYEVIALAYHPMGDFTPVSTPAFILDTTTGYVATNSAYVKPAFDIANMGMVCKFQPDMGDFTYNYIEWVYPADPDLGTPESSTTWRIKVLYREVN